MNDSGSHSSKLHDGLRQIGLHDHLALIHASKEEQFTAAPTHHTPRFDARWLGEVLALAALYFLTARLGLLMAIPGGHVTPVWPPSGIALAAVLLRGRRVWPGIWLGSFAANFWDFSGSPMSLATDLATSAVFGIGASLAALLGSQLLRRFMGERNPLERVLDVCVFMALGGVVSCLVSATVGVTTLCLAGFAPWSGYGQDWLTWWLGDTAGVFVVAPLLLVWGGMRRRKSATRWVELSAGFGLLIAVTHYVFIENRTLLFTGKPHTFILIPFLIWSAVRFGRRGGATAAGLIALVAVWGTIHGSGPFNLGSRNESLLALEIFLSVVSLTALCIAAVVMERRRVLDELESRVAERTASLDQANAALRESEARTQLLIKSSHIGLWDWDLVTNEVFISPEWKSQLGYADDELPNRYEEWESRLHPEDREPTLRALQDFREGRCAVTDFRLRHKDGSWRSILTRANLIRDAAGQPARIMGCHIDITARKEAEEALRESEERFRTIFEQAPLGISEGEIATARFISANQRYLDILGYTIDELRGLTFKDYTHPEDLQKDLVEFQKLAAGEIRTYAMEKRYIRKDGAIIWVNLTVSGLALPGEKPLRCMAVIEDITDRIQAEEALNAQALRYKTLMATSTDSTYVLDEKGDLQEANAAFLSRRGYTAAEVKGLNVADWDATWGREQLQERRRKLVDRSHVFESRHRCKDGSIFDVEVCATGVRIGREQFIFCVTRDITERKRAEEKLWQSLNLLRAITEGTIDAMYAKDRRGRYLMINTVGARFEGKTPEEVIGLDDTRLFSGETLARIIERDRAVMKTGETRTDEDITTTPDGLSRVHLTTKAPLRDSAGKIIGLVGVSRDITERERARQALQESEQRFRELAENIHEVFWLSDSRNARMNYISPAYEKVWGRSCESLYAAPKSWMDAVHPEDKEQVLATVAKRSHNEAYHNTYRIIRPDGSIRWIRDRGFPVRDESGEAVRFAGIAEDITSQKQAEEALRESEQQMRLFMEATADCLWKWDLLTGNVVRSVGFNRAFGYSAQELDSTITWWEERLHPDDRGKVLSTFQDMIASGGNVCSYEYRFRRKDGTLAVIHDRAYIVRDAKGKALSALGAMTDITERKRAAKDLEDANYQLRVLSRQLFHIQEEERRHLARELHDEIGQTLAAAKINLKIIAPDAPAKIGGRLDDSIQLLDGLLRQVRELSLNLRPPLLDELGLVPTLRWLVDQQAQRAGLRVTFTANANGLEIDPDVQTACFRVAQEAITNIIRHAEAKSVAVELRHETKRLWLSVRDDGAGFDPSEIQKGATQPSSLGLVSMKERALLVRGGLEFHSAPGSGTEIRAWFPLTRGERPSTTETA
jgi:PAS domain S-box-containing protein